MTVFGLFSFLDLFALLGSRFTINFLYEIDVIS